MMGGVEREDERQRQLQATAPPAGPVSAPAATETAEERQQRKAANQRDIEEQQALYRTLSREQRLRSEGSAPPPVEKQ